ASAGCEGSSTVRLGGNLTSCAMVAMRASCSGVRPPRRATPSSAITFSTMFSSGKASSVSGSGQPRFRRARDLQDVLGAVLAGLANFVGEIAQAELGGGGHGTGDQPRVVGPDQLADGVLGAAGLDAE